MNFRFFGVGLILLSFLTLFVSVAEPSTSEYLGACSPDVTRGLTLMLSADFERNLNSPFDRPGWTVEDDDGNRVLRVKGSQFASVSDINSSSQVIEFRVRIFSPYPEDSKDTINFHFGSIVEEDTSFLLHVGRAATSLVKVEKSVFTDLSVYHHVVEQSPEWREYRIVYSNYETVMVCLDGRLILSEEVNGDPRGQMLFIISQDTTDLQFDDFRLLVGNLPPNAFTLPRSFDMIPEQHPETKILFFNGNIITMQPVLSQADAVLVEGSRIMAVGKNKDILALKTEDTILVDLEGKTMLPGFVDAHSHLLFSHQSQGKISLEQAQILAFENGITSLGNLNADRVYLEQMYFLYKQGKLRLRTSIYLSYTDPCGQVINGDWFKSFVPSTDPSAKLRLQGVKFFADGGSCGRPATSYAMPAGGNGDLWLSESELTALLRQVQELGFQAAVHAMGDRAITITLNAIESVLQGKPNTLRHRIEHNDMVSPELVKRYGEVGVVPVIWGYYPTCVELVRHRWEERLGPTRLDWFWPWRDLLDSNEALTIAWHSDTFHGHISPFLNLYWLSTRQDIRGAPVDGYAGNIYWFRENDRVCEPPEFMAQNIISIEQALQMMTMGAAYALGIEEVVGSVEPGKLADLIIVSNDPLTITPDELRKTKVYLTMIGGFIEYCTEDLGFVCSIQPLRTTDGKEDKEDRDNDGVPDDEDYCPDLPGNPEVNGC